MKDILQHFSKMPAHYRIWELVRLPFVRLHDCPSWGKLLGGIGGLAKIIWADAFTVLFFLLVAINFLDHRFGVKAAEAAEVYDPLLAEYGWHSKLVGLTLVLAVRGLEWWGGAYYMLDTGGVVAVAVTLALISKDLKSLEHHRLVLGADPIPLVTVVVQFLDRLAERLLPGTVHREDAEDD